ncbi:MAG: PAS domain S-box protein [Bacteroidetes bacterium]|nr:PAS domain S-box protein [Bacteroidota bacterium]
MRTVLSLSKELFSYCSVFDDVDRPIILVDPDRNILYRNHSFDRFVDKQVPGVSILRETCAGLDSHLVEFFEHSSVYGEFECPQGRVSVRRVVSVEQEYATITFELDGEDLVTSIDQISMRQWTRALIEHAPEAILLLDFEKKRYVAANPSAVKLFGVSQQELLNSHLGEWSPELLSDGQVASDVAARNIQRCVETDESVEFDWEILKPDGTLIPCEIRVVRLPTPQGIYIRSSITDVSEKRKAELELKARKEQFRKLFGSEIFSVALCNGQGEIQESNSAFRKLTGYKAKEMKSMRFADLLIDQEKEEHQKRLEQVLEGDKKETTSRIHLRHKNGHWLICRTSAKAYVDWNGEVMMIKTIQDVTNEELTLKQLEASEQRFRSLFEKNIIGIMLVNAGNATIISANPAACKILNRSRKELIKNPEQFFKYDNEAVQTVNKRLFAQFAIHLLKGGTDSVDLEFHKTKDQQITVRVQGFVLDQQTETLVVGFTDITRAMERKMQFARRNNQLQAFIQHNIIPVAMFDSEMNYLFVGEKWREIYPTRHTNIIGRNYYELHPRIPQRWKLIHRKALNGETIHNAKDLHIRRDGSEEWFRWLVKPWYDVNDVVGGIIIYAENITDEVIAAEKARKQEARYKSFFENSTLGWIEINSDKLIDYSRKIQLESFSQDTAFDYFLESKVVNINDQVREIFGIGDMAVEEFEPLRFIQGSVQGFGRKLIHNLRHDVRVFEYDIAIVNQRGEERKLFISVRLPDDNDFRHIVFGVLDVTDLKSSISALRESEERYRTMFESNSLGVVYTNYRKNIIRVNAAFEEMFGYSEDDMQAVDEMELLYPRYRKEHRELVEKLKTGSQRFVSAEKEYKRKSGKRLIALTSSSALYDDEGSQYGTVTIIKDITEDKLNERRIQKQNNELKKINRELDQFVYSAAHDLRAPIANVLGLVTLLRMEEMSPTAAHYVDLQEKSLDKLDEFIKSIVDYSRNSRLALSKNEIDWKTYVTDVVDQYRYSENAERLKITIDVKQNSPFVSDSNRLSVVMNNLVSNAVRYMDVSKSNPYLKISVVSNSSSATVEVEDNGIGIEEKHLKSIFDLFYRANSESKGTGIGLYIVKETVTKLKGSILVKSKYKKGTKFTLRVKNFAPSKRKKR